MKLSDLKEPVIAAHRGLSSLFPENTMPAFIAALNLGCVMIELDVGTTKDGEAVVIHDATLERTTSGLGRVSEKFFSDIFFKADAGIRLSSGKISTKVPRLEEVLNLVKKRAVLNIEIKSEVYIKGDDRKSSEAMILELVKQKGMMEQVVFSSFNHKILLRLRNLSQAANLGILTSGEPRPPIGLTRNLNAYSWHPDQRNLSAKHIKDYKKHTNKKVIPYTVNKSKRASRLIKAGVSGFFTDYPQKFI
ncbi:MAG: glycerophosphodiester phosphodiesterase family protein [Desulforegulaceae bacterium]|nr:glycerophosphodiester phosphodiesterase family protein [Desulforegulaceae bacterium]